MDDDLTVLFEFSPGMGLEEVQAEYQEKLYQAMQAYLESDRPITSFRNEFRRAVNDAFTFAFVAGWADAGASGPITDDAQAWLNGRIEQEIVFADGLFAQLKALRDDKALTTEERLDAAQSHAEGYTNTTTGVYAEGKMMGEPERDGTWYLGDTEEHCDTCAGLDGQTHPMSWYIKNDYIPQQNGSKTLDCGGWRCDCTIRDPKSGEVLIP